MDGNKRTAIASYLLFLATNDMLTIQYLSIVEQLENIVVLTAYNTLLKK